GIAVISRFEEAFTADRRNAETISVMCDTRNDTLQNAAVTCARHWIIGWPEAKRIHHRDWTGAHGEDVAQDSAHTSGRALKGLDEARMIVRFNLESNRVTLADIDDSRVLARTLENEFAARREFFQMQPRAFVGAVLAPHYAENAQL